MTSKDGQIHRNTGERLSPSKRTAIISMHNANVPTQTIAKIEHTSPNTIKALVNYEQRYDSKVVEDIKKGLAGGWYITADRALAAMSDDKLTKASAPQLTYVAGVATDKARLVEGKSTVNHDILIGENDTELEDKINELEQDLNDWESGKIVNVTSKPVDTQ